MISTAPRPVHRPGAVQTVAVLAPIEPVASSVRITRRGRLVLLALVAILAFALVSLGQVAASAGPADGGTGEPVSATWVVQPGETLWVIAERVDPQTDPRETVARIVAMNDLPSSSVQAGLELQIPA
jgi:nucleoid-associated protein YgaU